MDEAYMSSHCTNWQSIYRSLAKQESMVGSEIQASMMVKFEEA